MRVEPEVKPISDEEIREDVQFLRTLLADPVRFERWANDVLDRGHRRHVERRRRR